MTVEKKIVGYAPGDVSRFSRWDTSRIGKFGVCHGISRKWALCPLIFLILVSAAFVPFLQAQITEQIDPFYLKLYEDGKYFFQNGDFVGAVSNFEIAFFGFVDNPPKLLECYIYLEVSYSHLKNADKTKYYYNEIKRLRLQTHLKSLELPEDLEVKYLELNAAFARLETKAAGSGVVASKTEPKSKTKPESQPPASSLQKEADSKPQQAAPPPSTSKKEADSKKAEDLSGKPAKQSAQTTKPASKTTIPQPPPVSPSEALAAEIKQIRDSIKKDKRNPDPYFRLSARYFDQKKFKDARAVIEDLLDVNPKNGRAHFELGKIYLAEQKTKEALSSFEKAAALLPGDPAVHYGLGKLYFDQKNYDKAKQAFARVEEVDKKYLDVEHYIVSLAGIEALRIKDSQVLLQKARAEPDPGKKLNFLIEALQSDPYNTDIYFEIEAVYIRQKQYKEAAELLELLLKYYPGNVRIYVDLGDVYIREKSFNKAATVLGQGIKIAGKNIELHYFLGRAFMGQKKYDLAAAEFDIVLAASPFYKDTRDLRKSCLDKIKK
jgi:tetratricopeptide (TPR) repeat protein